MPDEKEAIARRQYVAYCNARDRGHTKFIESAAKCLDYVHNDQWSKADVARLNAVGRPALTINKLLSTVNTVLGEQINNRTDISFRPRGDATDSLASILTKVYRQISDNNQLQWLRSDMFAMGVITARGFLEVRTDTTDSMMQEVSISLLNPKNVILDPDAEEYDPNSWSEVFITKWLTVDEIEVLYGKDKADQLRGRESSTFDYGYDSIQGDRDRFGMDEARYFIHDDEALAHTHRYIRVIERQYRKIDRAEHLVNPTTGDTRLIPTSWTPAQLDEVKRQYGFEVIKKVVRRIRWTVTADDVVLHDDWSPYGQFTVVPYFPFFTPGRPMGLVENLLGSQELLNKATSQELHVINTTANSGWKVKAGSLTNMTVEELEQKGAQTGLVVEVTEISDIEKITPNQVPTGLDRVTFKAEEHIKSISGVSDSMQGFDREDVAAKAIQAKRQAGNTGLSKYLDNLIRTDFILARAILNLVQTFYTEQRIMRITADNMTGKTEQFAVNVPTPEGMILNDLTIGEYDVVVTSVPYRDTLEDSEFEQAARLREMGIQIPDSKMIKYSRLRDKGELVEEMESANNTPAAQAAAALQQRMQEAEVAKTEADAAKKGQEVGLTGARTEEATARADMMRAEAGRPEPQQQDNSVSEALAAGKAQDDSDLRWAELEHKKQMDFMSAAQNRKAHEDDLNFRMANAQAERSQKREEAAAQAAEAAQKPQAYQPTKALRK